MLLASVTLGGIEVGCCSFAFLSFDYNVDIDVVLIDDCRSLFIIIVKHRLFSKQPFGSLRRHFVILLT